MTSINLTIHCHAHSLWIHFSLYFFFISMNGISFVTLIKEILFLIGIRCTFIWLVDGTKILGYNLPNVNHGFICSYLASSIAVSQFELHSKNTGTEINVPTLSSIQFFPSNNHSIQFFSFQWPFYSGFKFSIKKFSSAHSNCYLLIKMILFFIQIKDQDWE